MQLKLFLPFLLFLHAIHDVQSYRGQWVLNVPRRMTAVERNCVVIPCTYFYPQPKELPNKFRGFWRKGNKLVSTSLRNWPLSREYRRRTEFTGKLSGHNCTMLLVDVRQTDAGSYYFRIEMPQYNSFSYKKQPVTIDVVREPDPPSLSVKRLDEVYASCSAIHTCPSDPPRFSWSRSGVVKRQTKKLKGGEGKWRTVSMLRFSPRSADHLMPLNCTVHYTGGAQAKSSITL